MPKAYFVPRLVYKGRNIYCIGSLPEDIQKQLMDGKKPDLDYLKRLGMSSHENTEYSSVCIRPNDNVNLVRKKICIATQTKSPDDLYVWYKRNVTNDPVYIYHFLSQVFRKNKSISFTKLQEAAKTQGITIEGDYHMITKGEATRIMFSAAPKKVAESLCFSYSYDGYKEFFAADPANSASNTNLMTANVSNQLSLLLTSFDIMKDTFYIEDKGDDIYFPYKKNRQLLNKEDIQSLGLLEEAEKKVESVAVKDNTSIQHQTVINVVHIKGNDIPGINQRVDLEHFFNALVATDKFPFIKYKTQSNIYYRINKQALTKIAADEYQRWTQVSASKDDKSFVMVKIAHNSSYLTFTVNTDLSYTVKATLSIKEAKDHKDLANKVIPLINSVLETLQGLYEGSYVPTIPEDILTNSRGSDNVRVVQMITSTTMSVSTLKLNFAHISDVVKQTMGPYFNIIQSAEPSILHLQYKKVNNYTRLDNISAFITMNSKLERTELISQIISTFMVSKDEAEREIDAWLASQAEDDAVKKGRRFFDTSHLVNIKIRMNSTIDLKYLTNGVANLSMDAEITDLIKKLILLTEQYKKSQKKIKLTDEKLESLVAPVDMPAADDDDADDDDDDASSVMSASDDDDLLALQLEFADEKKLLEAQPEAVAPPPPVTTSDKPSKVKGYVLGKLYEADKALFEYKPPADVKRRDYASLCGWVDRRQPVVVSKEEIDKINKDFPTSINGFVKSGSTAEHHKRNHYICPKIWCPKSRVALSYEDYEKHGRKCPYPEIEEEPILFASKSFFGEGDAGLKKQRYPGYLDKYIHPDHLCLPCCFKVKPSEGNRNKQRGDMCVLKDKSEDDATKEAEDLDAVKDKYIKGANYCPLEQGRYGLLPPQMVSFLQQTTHQGNRHDGTGSVTDATKGIFRKGITQSDQSYINVLVSILDNPELKTATQLIDVVVNRLDILTFLSLENGRIMKMFIDDSKSVYDKSQFKKFYEWFKQQNKYILQMNLRALLKEIEDVPGMEFVPDKMPHHHDILREFIIYGSFTNFRDNFLKSERVIKEHFILADLVNNHMFKYININRYNIVHLEYVVEKDKIYLSCLVNKNKTFDVNYPFVFIMKRNAYYEPLVYVEQVQGEMDNYYTFQWKNMSAQLKHLVSFAVKNCVQQKNLTSVDRLVDFCKGIGYKPKYWVIDYGYKLCGLVLNHNLYLPLEQRQDFYYHTGVKYMYVSDVSKVKCLLDKDEITDAYKKIQKFMGGTKFYDIKEHTKGGLVLSDNVFVPLGGAKNHTYFKNGLFILVGYAANDKRRELTVVFEKELELIKELAKDIKSRMQQDTQFARKVRFLLDKNNPLPIGFKLKKLREMSKNTELDTRILYKLMEYLKDSSKHYKLYMRKTQRFTVGSEELFLDHFDVANGRLKEAIEVAENPHKAFLTVVDDLMSVEYSLEDVSVDDFADIVGGSAVLEDVPVKWRKILRGWKIVDNEGAYAPLYMRSVFQRIHARVVGGGRPFSDEVYEMSYTNRLTQAYTDNAVGEIFDNPWLANYFKKSKKTQNLDHVLQAYASINYYPSIFDVKVMAHLAKTNMVILGRKTTRNPDGLEVIKNSPSDMWVVLSFVFDRQHNHDRFSFYTSKGAIVFPSRDLNDEFKTILTQKMTEYDVEVVDDPQ